MKIAPRPYSIVCGNNTCHVVRVELWDTKASSTGDAAVTLREIIADMYVVYFDNYVFKDNVPVRIAMNISGAYKGEPRCIRTFPVTISKPARYDDQPTPRVKAFMNDVFVLNKGVLTFIPAEVLNSVNIMLGITKV